MSKPGLAGWWRVGWFGAKGQRAARQIARDRGALSSDFSDSLLSAAHQAAYKIYRPGIQMAFADRKQEAILALIVNKDRILKAEKPEAMARTIAKRAILKALRDDYPNDITWTEFQAETETTELVGEDESQRDIGDDFGVSGTPSERPASPDIASDYYARYTAALNILDVRRLIDKLSSSQRRFVELYFYCDMTLAQVAAQMCIATSTAGWLKVQTMHALRRMLGVPELMN